MALGLATAAGHKFILAKISIRIEETEGRSIVYTIVRVWQKKMEGMNGERKEKNGCLGHKELPIKILSRDNK